MRNSSFGSQLADLAALLLAIDKPDPERIAKLVADRLAQRAGYRVMGKRLPEWGSE